MTAINRINLFGNPPFQEKPGVSRHCFRNPPTLRILMVIGNAPECITKAVTAPVPSSHDKDLPLRMLSREVRE